MFSHTATVLAGACLYAVLFAIQNHFTVLAAAGQPGAAPIGLVFGLLAFIGFVITLAAWGRAALKPEESSGGVLGHQLGGDEARLAWVIVLILVLAFTVLGSAFLAVAFMVAALAVINVDLLDEDQPAPESVDIWALMGPGEIALSAVIITVFALFSLWFLLRLAMAYPATLASGAVRVLSVWPLSGHGRSVSMVTTLIVVLVPGVLILMGLNAASHALIGAAPISAQSAVQDGSVIVQPILFALASLAFGVGKIVLLAAPSVGAMTQLYVKFQSDTPT